MPSPPGGFVQSLFRLLLDILLLPLGFFLFGFPPFPRSGMVSGEVVTSLFTSFNSSSVDRGLVSRQITHDHRRFIFWMKIVAVVVNQFIVFPLRDLFPCLGTPFRSGSHNRPIISSISSSSSLISCSYKACNFSIARMF